MTRSLHLPVTLIAVLLLTASVASAGVPAPRFCQIDPVGVGDNLGTAVGGTPAGFDVIVRDINNAPLLGTDVMLDFSGTDVRVYAAQDAGTTVDATARTVTRIAATGSTKFTLRTGGFANADAVEVVSSGVTIGHVRWRSTDIDGLDGKTGLGDVAYFAAKYFAATTAPECNFNLSASDVPDLGDFTILAAEHLSGASGTYAW